MENTTRVRIFVVYYFCAQEISKKEKVTKYPRLGTQSTDDQASPEEN